MTTLMDQPQPQEITFQLTVNNRIQRTNTLGNVVPPPPSKEPGDKDPDELCRGKDYSNLRHLLRMCEISCTDGVRKFWPDQLLRRIMTKERVEKDLESFVLNQDSGHSLWGHGIQWYLQNLFPEESLSLDMMNGAENGTDYNTTSGKPIRAYFKIYTILVLCEQQPFLRNFIVEGIHDGDLPFVQYNQSQTNGTFKLSRRVLPTKEIPCFRGWKSSEVEHFHDFQYQVTVPYFCLSSDQNTVVKHARYHDRTIMPWIREDVDKLERGGYGIVSCMRIHPASHGFHALAQVKVGNGMFALKRITSKDIKDFENETKMLRLFSGHHDHLIMLLMSFSWNGNNYLLFPWAGCDLENYWNSKTPPYNTKTALMDPVKMKWVSRQILGLTSGLHSIHNPAHLHSSSDMRFGRHGDLKPENILWLQPEDDHPDSEGILVIGDLGISAIHRKASRSNQPGKKIPHSPNYRPPECDLEGGTVSRAFDIWTLGCLFLEMVCWTLGGTQLIKEFSAARTKVPYLGSRMNTNIFFDIQMSEEGEQVILVKDIVLSVSMNDLA
jgi:hypothetical protein